MAPCWAAPASAAGPAAPQLTVVPRPGTTLWVNGRPYAGEVVVARDSSGVTVVNRVGFEDYVDGIGEMPSSWPPAALQAQAVAARTYALWTVLTHPDGAAGGQICASDSCQVYVGLDKTESAGGANWAAAVQATAGQVLTYRGRIIEAVYGSSDGGQTAGGGVPWLPSISDPEDSLAPEHRWSWSAPLSAFAGPLGVPAGQTLASLVSSPSAITETLRAAGGATTTRTVPPSAFHSLINSDLGSPAGLDLPLPSWRYSVSTYGTQVRISGYGDGEGMGLSQYGALGKAQEGWTAGQILGTYYRGTSLTRLPANQQPPTIGVTLASDAGGATVQASGPVDIIDPDGRTLAATTAPASWRAESGGAGVDLEPEPGGPPGSPPPLAASVPPAPLAAPAPDRTAAPSATTPGSAPAPATTTTDRARPASTGASIATAYERPGPPARPTALALIALVVLMIVSAAAARVGLTRVPDLYAGPDDLLTAGGIRRPAGAHYRGSRK